MRVILFASLIGAAAMVGAIQPTMAKSPYSIIPIANSSVARSRAIMPTSNCVEPRRMTEAGFALAIRSDVAQAIGTRCRSIHATIEMDKARRL